MGKEKVKSRKSLWIDVVLVGFLLWLSYLVFFKDLGEFTLRNWDESRNAVNAFEMLRGGNWLVPTFQGEADMWNTKPPLHIWVVTVFLKLFGVSEFSLRLPSAIAGALVVLSIYVFGRKYLKSFAIGLTGSLVLLSSMGFSDWHIGRTADYDALLVFLTFVGSLLMFVYLETKKKNLLYLSTLFFILAVMTKSIAGIFLIPGIGLYMILQRKMGVFTRKEFWVSVAMFTLVVGGYYGIREMVNPGYLSSVWVNDLFGRYSEVLTGADNGFGYYWKYLSEFRFQKWIYIALLSLLGVFVTKDKKIKNWIFYSWILVWLYFLIISTASTKQLWYDAQIYPLASLLVASFVWVVINRLPWFLKLLPVVVLVFYMQRYVRTNVAYIHRPDFDKNESCLKYGYYLREVGIEDGYLAVHGTGETCNAFVFYMEANDVEYSYVDGLEPDKNYFTCDQVLINEMDEEVWDKRKSGECYYVKVLKNVR